MRRVLQIVIVLIILDIAGLAALWYGSTIIQTKKNNEATLESDIAEESQKSRQLVNLGNMLALAEKDRPLLEKYLIDPSEEGQIAFVSEMEQLGTSTTGVHIETRAIALTQDDPQSLHGDFVLSGSWSQIFYTLRLIEEYPSRVIIDRFDIKHDDGESAQAGADIWSGTLSVDMRGLRSAQ